MKHESIVFIFSWPMYSDCSVSFGDVLQHYKLSIIRKEEKNVELCTALSNGGPQGNQVDPHGAMSFGRCLRYVVSSAAIWLPL